MNKSVLRILDENQHLIENLNEFTNEQLIDTINSIDSVLELLLELYEKYEYEYLIANDLYDNIQNGKMLKELVKDELERRN